MRNTHTSIPTQVSTHIFCRIFWNILNLIFLDAQIKEYNSKLSTTPNTYDESRNDTNTMPTAPQLQNLNHNHPLSLVPQNFRNIALTHLIISRSIYPQSSIQHIITQQTNIEDTYEQILEQPHTTNFRSQNKHLFSPRWAARLDPSIDHPDHPVNQFPTQSTSRTTSPSSHFMLSPHLNHLIITLHPAWNQILIPTQQYITLCPNSTTPISKHPTSLPTLNPVHLHFPNLPFNLSIPKSKLKPFPLPLAFHMLHPYIPL